MAQYGWTRSILAPVLIHPAIASLAWASCLRPSYRADANPAMTSESLVWELQVNPIDCFGGGFSEVHVREPAT